MIAGAGKNLFFFFFSFDITITLLDREVKTALQLQRAAENWFVRRWHLGISSDQTLPRLCPPLPIRYHTTGAHNSIYGISKKN